MEAWDDGFGGKGDTVVLPNGGMGVLMIASPTESMPSTDPGEENRYCWDCGRYAFAKQEYHLVSGKAMDSPLRL